jgi:soluble P-type ATPase
MIVIDTPGWGKRQIEHLVLDFNGTIACDGRILPEVEERLARLSIKVRVHICTADHFRTALDETRRYAVALKIIAGQNLAEEKAEFVRRLGPMQVAAIGNGAADARMLAEAALSIAVIGPEGASPAALSAAQLVCNDIASALDLLLFPNRLAATLRR